MLLTTHTQRVLFFIRKGHCYCLSSLAIRSAIRDRERASHPAIRPKVRNSLFGARVPLLDKCPLWENTERNDKYFLWQDLSKFRHILLFDLLITFRENGSDN